MTGVQKRTDPRTNSRVRTYVLVSGRLVEERGDRMSVLGEWVFLLIFLTLLLKLLSLKL